MIVSEIIHKWLKDNKYDGLCNGDMECGCTLEDLGCCDNILSDCEPAYKGKAPRGFEDDCYYYMYADKEQAERSKKKLRYRIRQYRVR